MTVPARWGARSNKPLRRGKDWRPRLRFWTEIVSSGAHHRCEFALPYAVGVVVLVLTAAESFDVRRWMMREGAKDSCVPFWASRPC